MRRNRKVFPLQGGQYEQLKQRMLSWSEQFSILLFLDSNNYTLSHSRYECLLAVEPIAVIGAHTEEALTSVYEWHQQHQDWLFGHISYDYKNVLEPRLTSANPEHHHFPSLRFFCPSIVCYIEKGSEHLTIAAIDQDPEDIYRQILYAGESVDNPVPPLCFHQRMEQQDYLDIIHRLRQHIEEGDCYEINFCNEGYVEQTSIVPLNVFRKLNKVSSAPFAAYYRWQEQYMMCTSPERYLYKEGNKVIAQPIKGTARRDADEAKDKEIKHALSNSIKDKAENVMIVDLMRNDLSRSCQVASVQVDELFGIYSFPQVHQMISTIQGTLMRDIPFTDAIRYSFPMGSMTGAPKIKVMELIDKYERCRRSLFSGTVGYINPDGDFDFNVVIRSLFYNARSGYLSYQTGGAITYDSDPIQEWEEMRLKAWALEHIFSDKA